MKFLAGPAGIGKFDHFTLGTAAPANPAKSAGDPAKQSGTCVCGDPINLGTGSVFEQVTDYSTAGANPLAFVRSYNSLGRTQTLAISLGLLWRSNYDRYLAINSATSVTVERADGRQLDFNLTGGTWTPDTDVEATLTQAGTTWTFTDGTDVTETYVEVTGTNKALLQTSRARTGYTQTLAYDPGGQLLSVTDSYNRTLSFTYSAGLLRTLTTPDGLVLTYSFQAVIGGQQLTQVAYATTPVTSQSYLYGNANLPLALTGIVDENGNTYASWTYDALGRALTNQQAGGVGSMLFVYNDSDGSRTVTNALSQQEIYRFTTLQGVPKLTQSERLANGSIAAATRLFTYDANGYAASETDWNGNLTTYVNNARGQPTTLTQAGGTPQARTTTFSYDTTFVHLPQSIAAPGLTTTFTYDASGNLLTRTEADTTTTTVPYSTNGTSRTWTFTWGANFLPASVRGPRTDLSALTTFAYDASGTLIKLTNALNQSIQVTQHLPGGLPQTALDANGVTRQFTYDARQRLLTSTVTTAQGALTTTYTYDATGNVLSVTLPGGAKLANTYDAAHRLTAMTDLFNQKIAYTLDALGGATQTRVLDAAAAEVRRQTRSFDALGQVLQEIGGVNQTTAIAYDANGNALTITDPLARATQRMFDALNRPTQVTDPAAGITFLAYDAQDRLTSVADPTGNTTTYVYNGFGAVIAQTSPVTGTTVYRYDPAGNLTQKVDARGAVANHTYDALNRRLTTAYPANSAENVTYAYDEGGSSFGTGRLTSLVDAAGSLSLAYDERGNRVREVRSSGGTTQTTSYAFDAASRITAITYPSGWTIGYVRDAMGRSTAVNARAPGAGSAIPVVSAITYQPFGPVRALTYGNGLTETRSYDLDQRLTSVAVTGSTPRQSLTYGYDAANNVTAIADGVNSGNTQGFTYDALDRLVNAAGGYGTLAYSYDKLGNRLSETPPASAAPPLDGLGTITSFTYNQAGRMAAALAGAQTLAQYSYDAFGQRLAKTQPGPASTTRYQFDRRGRLLEETSGQGNAASTAYIYLDDGRPVATLALGAGTLQFLHADHLGTPQLATDASQALLWRGDYQPFGQVGNTPVALVQNLRFPGQQADAETGIYHNGFRDYLPNVGRYTQSDPIGLAGGLNTYAYVGANPQNNVDPSGQGDFILSNSFRIELDGLGTAISEHTLANGYRMLADKEDSWEETDRKKMRARWIVEVVNSQGIRVMYGVMFPKEAKVRAATGCSPSTHITVRVDNEVIIVDAMSVHSNTAAADTTFNGFPPGTYTGK